MFPEQKFKREVKTRLLTVQERQELIDSGMFGSIDDGTSPNGRGITVDDISYMTKVIAARDIISGEWHYYE